MEKLYFLPNNPEELVHQKKIFNFFNFYNVWWYFNNSKYRALISKNYNLNFPDGRILSLFLGISQRRGPSFTKKFLLSSYAKNKKHLFLGLSKKDIHKLSKLTGIPIMKMSFFDLPFIGGIEFDNRTIRGVIRKVKTFNPDFIWFAIGSPKQEILANMIYPFVRKTMFVVGAAFDFLLGNKKEAPKIWSFMGLEWFYRLITDFNHSKKKVLRSFMGLIYILIGKVKLEVEK